MFDFSNYCCIPAVRHLHTWDTCRTHKCDNIITNDSCNAFVWLSRLGQRANRQETSLARRSNKHADATAADAEEAEAEESRA